MLKQVAEYYDIKSEEVVVFGDGWNDLSMIEKSLTKLMKFDIVMNIRAVANYIYI